MAWAPDGSLYLAGQSYGALDFGAGPVPGVGQADIYVARYAASGELDWVQRFGDGLTLAFVKGLAANDVGVAVAGHFDGAITVGDTHHVSGPGSDALVAWLSTESGTPQPARHGQRPVPCNDRHRGWAGVPRRSDPFPATGRGSGSGQCKMAC